MALVNPNLNRPTSLLDEATEQVDGKDVKPHPQLKGWVLATIDPIGETETVQNKGRWGTVADAVANAPGEGANDVATVPVNGVDTLHYWDEVALTFKVDDAKAPVQTDASKDAFVMPEAQWNANQLVPYESPTGNIQMFYPVKTTDYAAWAAIPLFENRYKAVGSVAEPYSRVKPLAYTTNDEAEPGELYRKGSDLRIKDENGNIGTVQT